MACVRYRSNEQIEDIRYKVMAAFIKFGFPTRIDIYDENGHHSEELSVSHEFLIKQSDLTKLIREARAVYPKGMIYIERPFIRMPDAERREDFALWGYTENEAEELRALGYEVDQLSFEEAYKGFLAIQNS